MKVLNINVVTYVPKDQNHHTMLEIKDSLLPTLFVEGLEVMINLNVIINNDTSEEAKNNLQTYLHKYIDYNQHHGFILQTDENNLMKARNKLLRRAFMNPRSYTMQLDDDDRMMPTWKSFINAVIDSYYIDEDKLNFYMFKWERDDGDFYMPKDIKSKPIEELGRSTFTFSNWGWIAKTSYLMKMGLVYPEFIESPKLDDNYFHLRSYIMNPEANYILCPIYVWNNKTNKSSVSNRQHEFVDDLMEYFKAGNPGYKMTPLIIRDGLLQSLDDLGQFSYPCPDLKCIHIKNYPEGEFKFDVEFDEVEMCYKYQFQRLKNLMPLKEYVKLYSTYQLRLLGKVYGDKFKSLHEYMTIPNGRTENGDPNWEDMEGYYIAEFE